VTKSIYKILNLDSSKQIECLTVVTSLSREFAIDARNS